MTLEVIGAGWGRTATNSTRLALEQLGFGTCHHMYAVGNDKDRLLPLWHAALRGQPDWDAIFQGNKSAVDWPVAGYWRELADYYPDAKFILTTRTPESWYTSISDTILKAISNPEAAPKGARPVLEMARKAVMRSIGEDFSSGALIKRFAEHEAAVRDFFPPDRLLVFSPAEGWGPLCAFLGTPIPNDPFPRTNHRDEFFAKVDDFE